MLKHLTPLLLAACLVGSVIAQTPTTNSASPVVTLATTEPITIDLAKRTWQGIPCL
jgi:hypothetical protein